HSSQLQDRDQRDRGAPRPPRLPEDIRAPTDPRASASMTTLGFVGLGAMGGRMARRLLDGGFAVRGYNRTAAKAAPLVQAGMMLAPSPRDAAEGSDAVFTMVTDDTALEAVARGPQGLLAGLRPGAILIEMSTVSPTVVGRLAEEAAA